MTKKLKLKDGDLKDAAVRFAKLTKRANGHVKYTGGGKAGRKFRIGETTVSARMAAWLLAHKKLPTRRLQVTCKAPTCVDVKHLAEAASA